MATGVDKSKIFLLSIPGMFAWGFIIAGLATDNKTLLGIGGTIMIAMVVIGLTFKGIQASKKSKERAELWARGETAKAKVIKISTRGGGINDHPLVQFELEITRSNGETYKGITEAIISQLAIPRIQPGCEIKIIVDPEDRSSVLIDEDLTPYGYNS